MIIKYNLDMNRNRRKIVSCHQPYTVFCAERRNGTMTSMNRMMHGIIPSLDEVSSRSLPDQYEN